MVQPHKPMKTLAQQISVYAAYHRNPTNKVVHFVFVPLILWSAMGLLTLPGAVVVGGIGITAAHVASMVLLVYYIRLDFPLGIAMAALFTFLLVTALEVGARLGSQAWILFGAVFVLSWLAQIVGHKAFEHRKPALADDLFQVFVAPLFVVAEWGFALGLRRALRSEVEAEMQAHLSPVGAGRGKIV